MSDQRNPNSNPPRKMFNRKLNRKKSDQARAAAQLELASDPAAVASPSQPGSAPGNRPAGPTPMRLQRLLALAGYGSRRECEDLITAGRVEIDGKTADELGTRVDAEKQKVFVDGERVKFSRPQYFAVNKPPGVLSTNHDPSGRARVIDLIDTDQRVFTVGRLDKSSQGLMIVTNDGDLANQLTHPKFGVHKVYHVHVQGSPRPEDMELLRQGVHLADGFAKVQQIKIRNRRRNYTELEMILDEGRNREIRRLLARIGHKVLRLQRVAIGPLRLGELPQGAHRRLKKEEIELLRRSVGRMPSGSREGSGGRHSSRPAGSPTNWRTNIW